MAHSPSYEANMSSDNQNFPELYETQKIVKAFKISLFFFRILSQIKPIHILPFSFFNINFNIILISTPGSFKSSLQVSRQKEKTLFEILYYSIQATCPARLIIFNLITRTIFGKRQSMQYFPSFPYCIPEVHISSPARCSPKRSPPKTQLYSTVKSDITLLQREHRTTNTFIFCILQTE